MPIVKGRALDNNVYVTQTDTTIGFISQSADRLDEIKGRSPSKHYIRALPSLGRLKAFTRVPQSHKNRVRRARRSTFIFPDGHSYRVVAEGCHHRLIERLGWAYTTSANRSGEAYHSEFAESVADIIVGFPAGERGDEASRIYRVGNATIKRIR